MIDTLPFHDNIIIFEVMCTTTPYFGKCSCMSISSKFNTFQIILFNLSNKYCACILWFDAIRWSTVVYVTYETVFFHSFDIMYYISFYLGSDRYDILNFLQRSQMLRQFSVIYDKFLTEKCPRSGIVPSSVTENLAIMFPSLWASIFPISYFNIIYFRLFATSFLMLSICYPDYLLESSKMLLN